MVLNSCTVLVLRDNSLNHVPVAEHKPHRACLVHEEYKRLYQGTTTKLKLDKKRVMLNLRVKVLLIDGPSIVWRSA